MPLCVNLFETAKIKMGKNQKIDIKHLLNRMLSGELTEEEKGSLQEYIESSYNDTDLDILMREHWQGMGNKVEVGDEWQFQNLKKLVISRINSAKELQRNEPSFSPSRWINLLTRVAAILFLPLLLGSVLMFYFLNNRFDQMHGNVAMQQVVASPGSRVHFTLPDNTEVWLNSESKLEFPMNLTLQKNREVKLTGQGYFKVAHDIKHPFIVMIGDIGVKALGTAFDVSGYTDEMQIKSTLEEGSIALLGKDDHELARLIPGQQAVLDRNTHNVAVENVETSLSTSWKDGKLIFRNTSLTEVTKQLERWFNCEIHIDKNLLNSDLSYTATIQDETLGEVLKMIEISTSVKVKIEKREVFIEKTK